MNIALFNWINSFAERRAWIDHVGVFFAVYLAYILVAVLLYIFFFRKDIVSRKSVIVAIVSAIIARLGFTTLIRFFHHNPRPFDAMQVHQLIPESGYSFPSGHAAFFFALAMGVYMYNKKLGWIFFIAAAIMGVARVFAGFHWPADILGGVGVGMLTAVLVDWIASKFVVKI